MTEKSSSADLLGLSQDDFEEHGKELTMPTMPEDPDHVDDRNQISKHDERAFLRDVLGVKGEQEYQEQQSGRLGHRSDEQVTNNWEDKPVNPQNKPIHPSVTEEYHTEGGKQVKAVHDDMGSMWHIEFAPGGELPKALKGKYTTEQAARKDIKKYLATR